MPAEVDMPSDWDDHPGWEAYFAALPSDDFWYEGATTSPGSFSFDRLGSLIDDLLSRDWTTLWFPGCGFSPLPRAFASFGFTVHATDIAPSAIEYQQNNESIVQPLIARVGIETGHEKPGCLTSQIHDFRKPFGDHKVDAIFNIKSFQGLPQSSMASASRSHFAALRPGGVAFFDTMNVQGEHRNQLEDALADAGFYVPVHTLNKWYRKALAGTGIPHVFVLGSPMISRHDDCSYSHKRGSPQYERDIGILRGLTTEYRSRMETEYEREQRSVDETTKHAQVIYSTG